MESEPALQAAIVPVTPFQQNCTLYRCTATGRGAVVDPGGDVDRLMEAIDTMGMDLEKILITHGHIDHAGGAADLAKRTGVPIEGPHRDDGFWIDTIETDGPEWGLPEAKTFAPTRWLDEGDTVSFGDIVMDVHHCPGHTPGHVIFFHDGMRLASVGDVLFKGSIGRTDFPRGNFDDLVRSITTRLWPLGDDVTFIPGHGPVSQFGVERQTNPFVSDTALSR
ncbi:MAG: MBL fold metallo-hydrolase [Alphaproteobacteria bacterium]